MSTGTLLTAATASAISTVILATLTLIPGPVTLPAELEAVGWARPETEPVADGADPGDLDEADTEIDDDPERAS